MTEAERIMQKGFLRKDFLKEEVICDFLVDEKRKKIWAIELDLLREFDRVCKKYNLKYYMWFGSLIGAIRHHGFIPWDDDLDVAMLREDYERFMEVAKLVGTWCTCHRHKVGAIVVKDKRIIGDWSSTAIHDFLESEGFINWGKAKSQHDVDWLYINIYSKVYSKGMYGVGLTKVVGDHAITFNEFFAICPPNQGNISSLASQQNFLYIQNTYP